MSRPLLSRIARKLPEPVRRFGRNWWQRHRTGLPLQLRMTRALGEVEAMQLAPGYSLVDYAPQFHAQWLQLLNTSGEFGVISEAVFKRELLDPLLPDGAAFVFHGTALVACAGVFDVPALLPAATLNYVMVHPEHRGHRLAQNVTIGAMARARAAGYVTVVLHTDDFRLAAIKTYLKLGFVPVTTASLDAPARWSAILSGLKASR